MVFVELKLQITKFRNPVLFLEKLLYHVVPGVFQRLVHGEGFERCTGNALKSGGIIAEIQIESLNVIGIQAEFILLDKAGNTFRRQTEYKTKSSGVFSL